MMMGWLQLLSRDTFLWTYRKINNSNSVTPHLKSMNRAQRILFISFNTSVSFVRIQHYQLSNHIKTSTRCFKTTTELTKLLSSSDGMQTSRQNPLHRFKTTLQDLRGNFLKECRATVCLHCHTSTCMFSEGFAWRITHINAAGRRWRQFNLGNIIARTSSFKCPQGKEKIESLKTHWWTRYNSHTNS